MVDRHQPSAQNIVAVSKPAGELGHPQGAALCSTILTCTREEKQAAATRNFDAPANSRLKSSPRRAAVLSTIRKDAPKLEYGFLPVAY